MEWIFRHMVYCCLSSIPISNAEECLRTYQECVSQNGSAVCFATTGPAHWVRGSLGHSFLLWLLHPPTQAYCFWEGSSRSSVSLATCLSSWLRRWVGSVIKLSKRSLVPQPAGYKVDMVFVRVKGCWDACGFGGLQFSEGVVCTLNGWAIPPVPIWLLLIWGHRDNDMFGVTQLQVTRQAPFWAHKQSKVRADTKPSGLVWQGLL